MYLKNAIEKILNNPAVKRKEHLQLKKACESALERLNAEIERNVMQASLYSQGILPNYQDYILADQYFLPFELACQSKNAKIVIIALDCLQKLIAYGHLIGDCQDTVIEDRLLIDRIVQTICFPFQGPHTDDAVQLQIIKAILALVLSNTCKVHEGSMLLAVRTCFNIYLASRSPINQSTAKGILTQTINSVFSNKERLECKEQSHIDVDLDEASVRSVMDSIVNQLCAADNVPSDNNANNNVGSRSRQSSSSDIFVPNGSVTTYNSPASLGFNSTSTTNLEVVHDEVNTVQLEFKTMEEKDAFLIFRALCKLSMKDLPENPDPKYRIFAHTQNLIAQISELLSHESRSKLLSLEMILLIVQNFNMPLTEKHSFLFAIRHFLCVALTSNAVSPIIDVFEKALAIFVQLVNKLKTHLKRQIEVFFKEIIISILESPSSSFDHKWVVLNTVSKIFDNAQSVVDIYVNYDCNLDSANIIETLVRRLSKIASDTTVNPNAVHKERERRMREMGLECLVKLLQCLSVWYEELNVGKNGELFINGECDDAIAATNGLSINSSSFNCNSNLDTMSANQLLHLKQQKGIIEHGIELFARKPKEGLCFLQTKGFVGTDPINIARFFHIEERLNKMIVGDFLGDGNEFNKEIMYAYVDAFDFAGSTIVQALRTILDKFRLPGEAQKIDRIMEKFASRYCECNPGLKIFASADTAYVLSYSIIMLTTDLHNPQVKQKMTKEQYIKMNRGINDQGDLPDDFLKDIYDDIAANEIKTKPGVAGKPKLNVLGATWRQRKLFQNIELESIAQTARARMEAATFSQTEFTSAHFEHVKPMFNLIWTPCLAAFSIGLQDSDDKTIWQRCLQGFRYGIRVACVFRQSGEHEQRSAFVQALTRFTLLTAKSSLFEMKAKNIESIKLLITIGDEDGNFLDECWYDCLKCISQLELAQLISSGNNIQSENFKSVFHIDEKSLSNLQECLGETSSQSVIVAVDKIFQGSSKLTGEAIVHFVRSLCRVSMEELSSPVSPRMFMLQKIVEISFYNMNRIRIEWSMIWNFLGEHFNLAGCSTNETVSRFALDALRQLSMNFLQKGELPNFRLQKEFLRPFEVIMARNKSLECREMIIACITNMVKSHADQIRSGWKNVFAVCTMAAVDSRETVVNAAFWTVTSILRDVYSKQFVELINSFHEAIKCVSEFACNLFFLDISMEAIRIIRFSASLVSKNTEFINNNATENIDNHQNNKTCDTDSQEVWCKGWFPIIFELTCIIQRCKLDVRTRSLTVMFEIVKTFGNEFNGWWVELFNVIFRIFDFIKHDDLGNDKNEWMMTTCNHALYAITDVFTQYFTQLAPLLLDSVYQQLFWCIHQGNEQLAHAAINCFEILIVSNGNNFTDEMWHKTIKLFVKIFVCSMPEFAGDEKSSIVVEKKVFNGDSETGTLFNGDNIFEFSSQTDSLSKEVNGGSPVRGNGKIEFSSNSDNVLISSINQCVIQMEIVDAVSNILFGRDAFKVEGPVKKSSSPSNKSNDSSGSLSGEIPRMYKYLNSESLMVLVDCLLKSHAMARQFNNNSAQRTILWKAAFKGTSKPNLQKLEAHSVHCSLNILFHLLADSSDESLALQYKLKLQNTVNQALDYYLASHSETLRSYWLTVIQMLLNRTYELPHKRFVQLGSDYQLSVTRLIESEEQPIIRTALHRVMQRTIIESNILLSNGKN